MTNEEIDEQLSRVETFQVPTRLATVRLLAHNAKALNHIEAMLSEMLWLEQQKLQR